MPASGTIALALATPAQAQNDQMTSIATPPQPNAIVLGTGPMPGTTQSESWHRQYGSAFARNVTVATLTPYLPDPAKANGTADIVAPGGGFMTLSMENEGSQVAQALASHGVAAFVLKYRLNPTPADLGAYFSVRWPRCSPRADGRSRHLRRARRPLPASHRSLPFPAPHSRWSAGAPRSGT